MTGWTLDLPFDDDDPQFRRGYEIGHLDALLQQRIERGGPWPVRRIVHTDCAAMLMALSDRHRLSVIADEDDTGTWLTVTYEPQP